jgi:outer membrane usher protein
MRREFLFRPWRISALLFCAVVASGAATEDSSSTARTREELFRAVFKRPPPPIPVDSYVMVVIDGTLRQKMRAVLAPDGQILFLDAKTLTSLLSQTLQPELLLRLRQRIDSRGFLGRAALEEVGLTAAFNARSFEFVLTTAPTMRAPKTLYLSPPPLDPLAVEAVRPASVSSFLNFNLKGTDRKTVLTHTSHDLQQWGLALDGAVNISGVVLEGSAFGDISETAALDRGDVRLVYDLPQQALRFTAGDLSYPVTGYQTPLPMAGIGLSTDFSLQPQVLTYWAGELSFELERPAEVKIFMNDSLISTLQLPAGVHDVRRFAPAVGYNDIQVVIDDSAGRREVLNFSLIHDPALLEKGLDLYSWNVGFARELNNGEYRYDTSRPVFSGSYLRGVTDATTLGAYAQALEERTLLGVQALQALPIGSLQLNTAVSRTREGELGGSARISLTTSAARNGPQSYFSIEYLGKRFNANDGERFELRDALNFQASMAIPLRPGWTGRLSGNYFSARESVGRDVYGGSATLYRRWGRHVTGSLSLRHGRMLNADSETEVLFGLTVNFTHPTGSYSAAKELESDRVSAQWNSMGRSRLSTPYAFALARTGEETREYQGGGGYWGNQGLVEASYLRSEIELPKGPNLREEATLRVQSSLTFADGTLALARPVRENFAIVTGKEGLENVAIKVDPDSRGASRARSAWLSPAVITDLSSYRVRNVRVEPVDPPLGATPDKMTFQVAPTYKSGVLLKVGKEPRILAVGHLVDDLGAPIAYLPVEIRRVAEGGELPLETFTGKNGSFHAPDLKPGKYEIRLGSGRWGSVSVDIPESPDGICRLGRIVVPPGS